MQGAMGELEVPRRRSNDASSASRRRHLFFCLASLWGYLLGVGVLAAAMSRGDVHVQVDSSLALWLLCGSFAGIVGGFVAAGAYREARRRSR